MPIKYMSQIKASSSSVVFEVKVDAFEPIFAHNKLIMKFCTQYGLEAHHLLAGNNLQTNVAPILYSSSHIHNGLWIVLLMEKIEGALPYIKIRNELSTEHRTTIARDVANAMNTLHEQGLVHGDVRLPNILVTKKNMLLRTYLIDFEFAGRAGEAMYPANLDLGIFTWVDVEDFPHVLKKHDLEALKEFCLDIRVPQA